MKTTNYNLMDILLLLKDEGILAKTGYRADFSVETTSPVTANPLNMKTFEQIYREVLTLTSPHGDVVTITIFLDEYLNSSPIEIEHGNNRKMFSDFKELKKYVKSIYFDQKVA